MKNHQPSGARELILAAEEALHAGWGEIALLRKRLSTRDDARSRRDRLRGEILSEARRFVAGVARGALHR